MPACVPTRLVFALCALAFTATELAALAQVFSPRPDAPFWVGGSVVSLLLVAAGAVGSPVPLGPPERAWGAVGGCG